MTQDVFYQNEIELARAKFKTDYSDYVIIGEEENYLFSVLNDVLPNNDFTNDFCVIGVLCGSTSKEKLLKKIEEYVSKKGCKKCIICDENTLPFSGKQFLVSEREYTCLTEEKYVFEKSKEFLKKVHTNVLIFDKIIGPGCDLKIWGDKIIATDEDTRLVCGYTYVRDALKAVMMPLENGNVYNVSSFTASACEIKQKIHQLFSEKFSFECSLSVQSEKEFKALCPLKIKSKGLEMTDIKTALYLTASSHFGFEYDYKKNLPQYCSKLEILKKTELEILSEIDRICKKHDIKYFLSGGTLLGAVRYNKSIPWDDDIDIGMLRGDFEKFRKICPQELDKSKFAYASYTTEENCHYLFDKIRLKNTYFSTKFSSQYKIQDGVFVDVFVYDTTSPSEKKQKLHINLVKTAIRFLNVKWTGRADRSMNGYKLSLIIKPFLRFIPFKLLHTFSDKMLKFYNKKNSEYLIDGTGLNINRGAFKKECLESLTEIEFEGITVPIPANYDEFLKHIYGENYLQEPPLYQREGTHDFVRLDLGEYILDDVKTSVEQNLDGELF